MLHLLSPPGALDCRRVIDFAIRLLPELDEHGGHRDLSGRRAVSMD